MAQLRFPWVQMLVLAAMGAIVVLLLVVLERIGAGMTLIGIATIVSIAAFMVAAATLGATMRPSLFFLAGRQTGLLSGLTTALAVTLIFAFLCQASSSQGGFLAFSLLNPGGWILLPAIIALIVGAVSLAPMLRRSGAFTIVDFISFRFQTPIPTATALVAGALVMALLSVCGAKLAIGSAMGTLHIDRLQAAALMIVPATLIVIGGWRSLMFALLAAGFCVSVALAAPPIVTIIRYGSFSDLLSPASDLSRLIEMRLSSWGLTGHLVKSASLAAQMGDAARSTLESLGLTLGCLTLLSLSGLYGAGKATVKSSLGAAIVLMIIPIASTLIAGGAVLALDAALTGRQIETLTPAIRQGALEDSVKLCGASPSTLGLAALCYGGNGESSYTLKPEDIKAQPSLMGNSAVAALGLPLVFSFLYRTGPILIGLAGLMIGTFALAAMLGHSLMYRIIQPKAVTSLRLATVRILAVCAIIGASQIADTDLVAVELAFTAAVAIAVATILPMLVIAMLPRAGGVTASLTALGGVVVSTILLYAQLNPAAAAVYGFVGALFMACAGLASSPPSAEERALAVALAIRNDEAIILDRGA